MGQESLDYSRFCNSLEGLILNLRKTIVFAVTVDCSERVQIVIGNRRRHIRQARGHLLEIPVDFLQTVLNSPGYSM